MDEQKEETEEGNTPDDETDADKDDSVNDEEKTNGAEENGECENTDNGEVQDSAKMDFAGPCMVKQRKKHQKKEKKTPKTKRQKLLEESSSWDCNECTYTNNAEVRWRRGCGADVSYSCCRILSVRCVLQASQRQRAERLEETLQ